MTYLILSSFLVFVAVGALMELSFFLFKIRSGRIRAVLRSLLFFKLFFDLLLLQFDVHNNFINLSIFSCETEVELFLERLHISPFWSYVVSAVILGIGIVFAGLKIIQFFRSTQILRVLHKAAEPCSREVQNTKLRMNLKKKSLLVTDEIESPSAIFFNAILFPKNLLSTLSQGEFEAVIGHELEHLRWGDSAVRILCEITAAFFWWIPTRWWLKRLEEDQEIACDASVRQYQIDHEILAVAFLKTIRSLKGGYIPSASIPLSGFATTQKRAFKRMKILLEDPVKKRRMIGSILGTATASMTLIIFWACM